MLVLSTVLFALLFASATGSSVLRGFPNRAICTPEQSCSYFNAPYTFSLCLCPDFKDCPKGPEYATVVDGTEYRFCQQRTVPVCSRPDQYASSISGLLTSVHCRCPEGLSLVKGPEDADGTIHFYCGLPQYCPAGGYCGHLDMDEEYLMEECPCPPGTGCIPDPPLFWLFSRKTASCMPV